jgi:hypoxanthine phosphoribosyltransferase
MTDKYNYFYDEYYNDIATIYDKYKKIPNPHVVSIYRGSLPIGVHLSNALKCPMSIVKYQSRDGEDKKAEWILNLTHDEKIRPTARFFPHLIVVDDIYDTGKTFRAVLELPEFENNINYHCIALYGNKNDDKVNYLHEQLYRWIVFPWERVKGGM